ncbi:aBC transporter, permease protein, MalFG family [Collimonas fungivorans]|uniref:ABC transporter, permease protein, MalFG family n=1 Tax=Collimonas fungivorans TaxID=158899 RepID=A0A127PBZ4_9BURK|nr:aBC transporter, permease protein, MalFG family [Collimonas fungivorans]
MARIIADMPASSEAQLTAPGKAAARGKLVRGLFKALSWLGLALLVTVALFPVLWALLNSLKELMDIVSPTPRFLFRPTLDNYRQVLHTPEVLSGLYNSVLVVGAAVGLGPCWACPPLTPSPAIHSAGATTSSSSCCRCASCRRWRWRFR